MAPRTKKKSDAIRLKGVRHNNLKGFDLDLPLNRLIVVTGLSGSGKSSLAFDTLYAEGQRRYIETFSPYTRQFFDRMDKPQVDAIEGIPPAIAIEQRNAVKTTRSTVGTMTEINEHLKQVWPLVSTLHCRGCDQPVSKEPPQRIWEIVNKRDSLEALITFELPLSHKVSLEESLNLIGKQGYQRIAVAERKTSHQSNHNALDRDGGGKKSRSSRMDLALRESTVAEYQVAVEPTETGRMPILSLRVLRLDEALQFFGKRSPESVAVVQDRVRMGARARARFIEACEQAYHFGKGRLTIHWLGDRSQDGAVTVEEQHFSKHFHCAACDLEYREPTPALFSFNHPLGACPTCKGFGRVIQIDYDLALPDKSLSLNEGAVKPWRSGTGAESQEDLAKFCRKRKVSMDVPFQELPADVQRWVIDGDPDYGKDRKHQWPHAWYGVKGYFRWLESKAYKMHVRVQLSKYRAYVLCPDCHGNRLQPDALLYRAHIRDAGNSNDRVALAKADAEIDAPTGLTLSEFFKLPVRDAQAVIEQLIDMHQPASHEPLSLVLNEVRSRLFYLNEIGLGYLTLDRPTRSLSGGETERVNLTSCLGSRLVNTLYVLDEPSVGLHPRDTERLVKILEGLRDAGNTVVVVEHEEGVMRAADQIVDLGPGHGESGGELVFQGDFKSILKAKGTLTGDYLSGRRNVGDFSGRSQEGPGAKGKQDVGPVLKIVNASKHNLKELSVEIPLGRLVCISGVSGSGKTTLVRDVLVPALAEWLGQQEEIGDGRDKDAETDARESGGQQSIELTGADSIERLVLVDQSAIGRTPRSNPAVYIGAFDDIRELFAQSEQAKQLGFNASAFSFNSAQGQCDKCRGAGFEKIEMQFLSDVFIRCPACDGRRYREHILEVKVGPEQGGSARSIADVLESSGDEIIAWLAEFGDSRPALKALKKLRLLQEVGLGYLRLGQPVNTLSGGECQRLKLVSHLAEVMGRAESSVDTVRPGILFLFDEPTTGLHFEDVRVLLEALRRLVSAGHSVLVIEHHLDVIRSADWVIDLGPGAGDEGGRLVVAGTPDDVMNCGESFTGRALGGTRK